MKVAMRIKPDMLNKLPRKKMPVGEHMVHSDWAEYEINDKNVHHLESVGTKHWVEVRSGEIIDEEKVDEILDELEGEDIDELEGELVVDEAPEKVVDAE